MSLQDSSSGLAAIVDDVERKLAEFYGFAPQAPAAAHLVTRAQLQESLGEQVMALPEYHGRAGVYLLDAPGAEGAAHELFVGIHLDQTVTSKLEALDPTRRLDDRNLDEFCVLIEEVSHFHLILNRAGCDRPVSKLELEWQGEVDKLLVCAVTLGAQQGGDEHLAPLARKLYDGAAITADERERYWQATRHAARFWYQAMRESGVQTAGLRPLLRRVYAANWSEKLENIDAFGVRKAG